MSVREGDSTCVRISRIETVAHLKLHLPNVKVDTSDTKLSSCSLPLPLSLDVMWGFNAFEGESGAGRPRHENIQG